MEGRLSQRSVGIVGGGHNGLVAACYLANAGFEVTVYERLDHTGGAAVSKQVFPGVDVRLSRYAYLVSLLPDKIVKDLGLNIELLSRNVSSYTPSSEFFDDGGLLVERPLGEDTRASFEKLPGGAVEFDAWIRFYRLLEEIAVAVSPTLLEPLLDAEVLGERFATVESRKLWHRLRNEPLGYVLDSYFSNDLIKGIVATDGLIGTYASIEAPELLANKCFLYHVIGNQTGEWRVPRGGMGAVTDALKNTALARGVKIEVDSKVDAVWADGAVAEIEIGGKTRGHEWVLLNTAEVEEFLPHHVHSQPGCQMKVNMVLSKLPSLRSGVSPEVAFAGTFHMNESAAQLERAFSESKRQLPPTEPPFELYCHTLTDPSILGPQASSRQLHTLTLFGLHTPDDLFAENAKTKNHLVSRYLDALDEVCIGSFRECIATDINGDLCIEAASPVDLAEDLGLPRGNIFHGDLSWPWIENGDNQNWQASQWGVETSFSNVFICGSSARRGGAVSGIGGHNAAHALLTAVA